MHLLKAGSRSKGRFGGRGKRKSPQQRLGTSPGSGTMVVLLAWAAAILNGGAAADPVKLQVGDWVTECDILHETVDGDCSIIGVFRNTAAGGPSGSYSLLIDLRNHQVAVVGRPPPTRASLRIDRNPPLQCVGTPHCIFSNADATLIKQELATGSIVLVDIATSKGTARTSLSTKEYQVSLANLRAEGWKPGQ